MVKLNLKEIFKTKKRVFYNFLFKPEDIKLPPDLGEIKEPISVYVEITKEDGAYKVHMEIEGYVVLECSRCLTLYHKDISMKEVVRIEPYPMEDVVYLKPADLDVSFYENEEEFDLTNLVREQIILSIPIKPLCSPDCMSGFEAKQIEEEKITLGDLLKRSNML